MLRAKLHTASGPGIRSELLTEIDVPPNAYNSYPDVIVWQGRYFIPTPMLPDYREVEALVVE